MTKNTDKSIQKQSDTAQDLDSVKIKSDHENEKNINGNYQETLDENESLKMVDISVQSASSAQSASLQNSEIEHPYFSDDDFKDLPDILQKATSHFSDKRERDVVFFGSIGALSAIFPTVSGKYQRRTVYPHLYCYVIAPPGSGKGALDLAKKLIQPIHDLWNQDYQKELSQYKSQLAALRANNKSVKPNIEKPKRSVLIIPGDTSSAKLFEHLADKAGSSLIFETESSTIQHIFKNDWGRYDDKLCKAFHHEAISFSRKTNDEYLEIDTPKLAKVLSGVPGHILGLIGSIESGLFSRFSYYFFIKDPFWKNAKPDPAAPDLESEFQLLGGEAIKIYNHFRSADFTFKLTSTQWDRFDEVYERRIKEHAQSSRYLLPELIYRHGLMQYRIAMILSCLRHFENGNKSNQIVCEDKDFSIAEKITEILLQHAFNIFFLLPKNSISYTNSKREQLHNLLPDIFSRADAVQSGNAIGIAERTVNNYLKYWRENGKLLQNGRGGDYSKPKCR